MENLETTFFTDFKAHGMLSLFILKETTEALKLTKADNFNFKVLSSEKNSLTLGFLDMGNNEKLIGKVDMKSYKNEKDQISITHKISDSNGNILADSEATTD